MAFLNGFIFNYNQSNIDGYVSNKDYSNLLGESCISLTRLSPVGYAEIKGSRIEVITEGEYIEKNVPLLVIKVEGYRVVVKENK